MDLPGPERKRKREREERERGKERGRGREKEREREREREREMAELCYQHLQNDTMRETVFKNSAIDGRCQAKLSDCWPALSSPCQLSFRRTQPAIVRDRGYFAKQRFLDDEHVQ